MSRWHKLTLKVGNTDAGGDANLAYTNFIFDDWGGTYTVATMAANLVAFANYWNCAAGTYVQGIDEGDLEGSGQFPVAFPTVAYAALHAADSGLPAMTAYGPINGAGGLAPLGCGAVIDKRTSLTGRSGRGRMTVPWLSKLGVTDDGTLDSATATAILVGWNLYANPTLTGDTRWLMLKTKTGLHYVDRPATISTRLGRLRSRTK